MEKAIKAKAYKEAYVILSKVPKEDIAKIPNKIIKNIYKRMDKEYEFNIENFGEFEEKELLPETKSLLAYLFRDFWATNEQKEAIDKIRKYNTLQEEKEKAEKYPPDFMKRKNNEKQEKLNIETTDINQKNTSLIEIKENVFTKLIKSIKKFLKIK